MDYRDQCLAQWSYHLGYLPVEIYQKLQNSSVNFRQYCLQKKILTEKQFFNTQFFFILQFILQEAQKQEMLDNAQVASIINYRKQALQQNNFSPNLHFPQVPQFNMDHIATCVESLKSQGVFTNEDDQIYEQITNSTTQNPLEKSPGVFTKNDLGTFAVYKLEKQIGAGGMGRVYKAYHARLDRTVAIKVILGTQSTENQSRFLEEGKLTAKLHHPNIVTVHDMGTYQGQDYIVMDYIEGGSLSDLLAKKKLNIRRSLEIIKDVCYAMGYAHKSNIIHRDLKPSNIMMNNGDTPLVMDFGLAKNIENSSELTREGSVIGTPRYMAPEQAAGHIHRLSPATDVYSLGAILYQMITRKAVIDGQTPVEMIFSILHRDVIPPRKHNSKISKELESICLKALEKTPKDRYQNGREMAEDIERMLNGEAIEARRASFSYFLWKKVQRHKLPIAITTTISMLLLFTLGIMSYVNRQAQNKKSILVWQKWWERFTELAVQDQQTFGERKQRLETAFTIIEKLHQQYPQLCKEVRLDQYQEDKKIQDKITRWQKNDDALFSIWEYFQNCSDMIKKYSALQKEYEQNKREHSQVLAQAQHNFGNNDAIRSYATSNTPALSLAKNYQDKLSSLVKEISQIDLTKQRELSSKSLEKLRWKAQFIYRCDNANDKAQQTLRRITAITQNRYGLVLERILQLQKPTLYTLEAIRSELENIVLANSTFADSFYRIARLYHQQGDTFTAQIYYEKATRRFSDNHFFSLYYLGQIYSQRWHLLMGKRSAVKHQEKSISDKLDTQYVKVLKKHRKNMEDEINDIRDNFQQVQKKLEQIPSGSNQSYYRTMAKFYREIMKREDFVVREFDNVNAGSILHFYLCPQKKDSMEEFNKGLQKYRDLLKILESINQQNFIGETQLYRAKIYQDLMLLEGKGSYLQKVNNIIVNFEDAVKNQRMNVASWLGLARIYNMIGDFERAAYLYKQVAEADFAAQWQYILVRMGDKKLNDATRELERLLKKHPLQEKHTSFLAEVDGNPELKVLYNPPSPLEHLQMELNFLAFLYLRQGKLDKVKELMPRVFPLMSQSIQLNRRGKSYVCNLLFIIIALQMQNKKQAHMASRILWQTLAQSFPPLRQTNLLSSFLPWLQNYDNILIQHPKYRHPPKHIDTFINKLVKIDEELLYQVVNRSNLLKQIHIYLRDKPQLHKEYRILTGRVTGNEKSIDLAIFLLIKLGIDLTEKKILETNFVSALKVNYRKAIAHFRRSFSAKNKHEHLQNALDYMQLVIAEQPQQGEYHYAIAVILSQMSQRKNEMYEHLEWAKQLGWNLNYLKIDPLFADVSREKRFRSLFAKKSKTIAQISISDVNNKIQSLLKKKQPHKAMRLYNIFIKNNNVAVKNTYEKMVQQMTQLFVGKAKRNLDSPQKIEQICYEIKHTVAKDSVKILHKIAMLYTNRGKGYISRQELRMAKDDLNTAIKIDPLCYKAYKYRGEVYKKQNKPQQAQQDFATYRRLKKEE
ncbi:serine/threonine protein kinase [Candidatus Uabimicrobium amorphum]|uniref:non-specific serine/threonine protein kinase n=1 Tax=Uabimicrobium amorphum TaxID=2596890 RepID=A0A5S9IPG2_UABAM|nr:serine/threonine-protein kinase [Candidatus Uabimicrobium amorphum]BBM85061.1 protein kinase [Candidatus Uabimicrobium amorphum]